jgi:tetratricopeptide (TPR) repeat protein
MALRKWHLAGLGAASLLLIGAPLGWLAGCRRPAPSTPPPLLATPTPEASYLGSESCKGCHGAEYDKWKASHHALAMQPAMEKTVLGDFGGATFDVRSKHWRFFRRGPKFMVTAEGPDGTLHGYEVAYTFGVDPLQQYLIPFPGGRMQALSVAWDTRAKRWFFLYPGQDIPPGDWLHWTRGGQSWNAMCADCHSTNLTKGYDADKDTYQTTYSEVMVGCEACHGPGSRHAAWAAQPAHARGKVENAALVSRTSKLTNLEQVERCAPCHSRRAQLKDQGTPGGELLDRYLPVLLSQGVFRADGQIEAEDYEYHSFIQSKMYANGVRCSDCHDVHSGRHPREGNALCTRCHSAEKFDTAAHHHHEPATNVGAQCVSCHMPGQSYMVVHFRRDHSLRIPRPDVSIAVGAPSACGTCHSDRSDAWVLERYQAFWGKNQGPHYGPILAAGRTGAPEAEAGLVLLSQGSNFPAIARATALDLLGNYQSQASTAALEHALGDPDPLIRHTAVSRLRVADPTRLARALAPLLEDPVRAVQSEAATALAEAPPGILTDVERKAETRALDEYVENQRYMSDLPSGAYNLGNLYAKLGRPQEAEKQYRRSLRVDDQVYMAKVNLAMLLAQEGKQSEAEQLLRAVHEGQPQLADVSFDYGLLLAEEGKQKEAEKALRAALDADPRLAPAAYNLAILVGDRDPKEAAELAGRAAELRPDDSRYASTLRFYQAKVRQADAPVQ